jgi:hypothetical protein
MAEYTHTLIPKTIGYFPLPQQVVAFFDKLDEVGAIPREPQLIAVTDSDKVHVFRHPSGYTLERFISKPIKVKSLDKLAKALQGLDNFRVGLDGLGPTETSPLTFDFDDDYYYGVRCLLRPIVVSMSDWHDEAAAGRTVPSFGNACDPKQRTGYFVHPNSLKILKVPEAGSARFWIEFEFGKFLFPKIGKSLNLIDKRVLKTAEEAFDVKFTQGCRWCA